MTAFTILAELLLGVVLLNSVLVLRWGPPPLRTRLIVLQIVLIAGPMVAALLLPTASPAAYYWQWWSLLAALLASLGLAAALVLGAIWTTPSRLRRALQSLALSLAALLFAILVLEVFFSTVYASSDAFLLTTGARNWLHRYWKPINAQGYRDREHPESRAAGRRRIFVVGDSFAAGLGIEHIEDRFPDRLQALLGDRAEVYVLANFGWGTKREAEALRAHPVRPDLVILSYFINDIEEAAARVGVPKPDAIGRPRGAAGTVLRYSSFANFVYWRLYRARRSEIGSAYWDYLRRCVRDPRVQREQRAELDELLASVPRQTRWLAVLFPHLRDVAGSQAVLEPVRRHLEARGVPVIDISEHVAGRPWGELVVSAHDSHPSATLHSEVAQLIYESLNSPFESDLQTTD